MQLRLPQLIAFLIENNVKANCYANILSNRKFIVHYDISDKSVTINDGSTYERGYINKIDDNGNLLPINEFMSLLYKEVGDE